eukprot:TRINITY_DN4879_c0_g1_i1.p1 TRINITY_DN4879_c0_g1~~TRINITY_DN4879_c0_g1_i1.p1  ORF type:complete len:167 (+),score=11.25 TRINITY_DN4879_c0_g1_i1:716-1216(+)
MGTQFLRQNLGVAEDIFQVTHIPGEEASPSRCPLKPCGQLRTNHSTEGSGLPYGPRCVLAKSNGSDSRCNNGRRASSDGGPRVVRIQNTAVQRGIAVEEGRIFRSGRVPTQVAPAAVKCLMNSESLPSANVRPSKRSTLSFTATVAFLSGASRGADFIFCSISSSE